MKFVAGILLVLTMVPAVAHAAVGEWGKGQRAAVRLISSGVDGQGVVDAGIEIVLPDGWKTYWRSPGDAGIPPLLDFSASKNFGPASVDYPVPERLDDGFAVTNVYVDRVVLPLTATVPDRTKAVDISVNLRIGVCDEVCVPEDITATLKVPPNETDAEVASQLEAAQVAVPGAPQPGVFALDSVARESGTDGRPVFRFTGTVPDAEHADVFVEGPPDWGVYTPEYIKQQTGTGVWDVKFSRTGAKTPIAGASFRVTIRSADRAIDQTLTLD